MLDIFVTKTQLSRIAGLDRRNKQFEQLSPDALLLLGGKKVPLYATNRTAGLRTPIQPDQKP
jgi:hypothetical protein